jgi:prolyl oligopeptidase
MKHIQASLLLLALPCTLSAQLLYPKTKKVSHSDNYFGTQIEDPYRWLENDTAAIRGAG